DVPHVAHGFRECEQPAEPCPCVPAAGVDSRDCLVDDQPLPRVQHLFEQGIAVVEMPVEAAFADTKRLGELLDADRVGSADPEGAEALLDPTGAGGAKRSSHTLTRAKL